MFQGRDPYDVASFERYYGVHQVEFFSRGWFPLYGPIHLWLAVFFGLFPVTVASALWFVANLGGLGAIAAVVTRALDRRLGGPAVAAVTGFLILTRPGRATLETGQTTVVYVLLTYVAWSQGRRRPWVAALALACALGKPPFGLPLLALIVARRLWPVAVRAVGIFVVASLPIVIWLSVNAGSPLALWRAVVHNLSYSDHNPLDVPGSPGRIDGLSLVARYVHGYLGGATELAAFVVVVGVAAVFVTLAARRPGWPATPAVLLLLGLATMLSVAHEYYDLLLLAWPLAAVLRWPVERLLDRVDDLDGDDGDRVDDRPGDDPRSPAGPPGAVGGGPTFRASRPWGAVLAVGALPALFASVVPASAVGSAVPGVGTGNDVISTLTTACLLVALAGAMAAVAFDHPQEDGAGGAGATRRPPSGSGPPAVGGVDDAAEGVTVVPGVVGVGPDDVEKGLDPPVGMDEGAADAVGQNHGVGPIDDGPHPYVDSSRRAATSR
jgi:hypothetical protein